MEIQRGRLRNFGAFESAEFEAKNLGLVLIEGENHDAPGASSNGAGKSTLWDAISWCLFGKTLRDTSHDAVVRIGAKGGTSVVTEVTSFGRSLTITRYRAHPEHKNGCTIFEGQNDITPTTGVDAMVAKLLGVSFEIWQYTTCLGQGLAYRFSDLSDAERVRLLEDVLRLQVFEPARAYARTEQQVSVLDVTVAQTNEENLRQKVAQMEETELPQARRVLASLPGMDPATLALHEAARRDVASTLAQVTADQGTQAQLQAEREALAAELRTASVAAAKQHATAKARSTTAREAREVIATLSLGRCDRCGQGMDKVEQMRVTTNQMDKARRAQEEADTALAEASKFDLQAKAIASRAEDAQEALRVVGTRLAASQQRLAALNREVARTAPPAADAGQLAQAQVAAIEKRLQVTREKLQAEVAQGVAARRKQRLWTFWIDGFQTLRRIALERGITALSTAFSGYVQQLFGKPIEASVALVDKNTGAGAGTRIEIRVATPGGTYKSASGGEKNRIDLAMAFALHDLVTASTGFRSNILLADEVCTFVDEDGVARVVDVLRKKAEQIGTVFVMSQSPVWKNLIEDTWTVRKQGGISELVRHK